MVWNPEDPTLTPDSVSKRLVQLFCQMRQVCVRAGERAVHWFLGTMAKNHCQVLQSVRSSPMIYLILACGTKVQVQIQLEIIMSLYYAVTPLLHRLPDLYRLSRYIMTNLHKLVKLTDILAILE